MYHCFSSQHKTCYIQKALWVDFLRNNFIHNISYHSWDIFFINLSNISYGLLYDCNILAWGIKRFTRRRLMMYSCECFITMRLRNIDYICCKVFCKSLRASHINNTKYTWFLLFLIMTKTFWYLTLSIPYLSPKLHCWGTINHKRLLF